jgi:hypothetical protein
LLSRAVVANLLFIQNHWGENYGINPNPDGKSLMVKGIGIHPTPLVGETGTKCPCVDKISRAAGLGSGI